MKRVSVLNLGRQIPQRDVVRMILGKLNHVDQKLIWAAHNKNKEQQLITDDKFFEECLTEGYLEVVKWLYAKNPRHMIKEAHKYAAIGGHIHIIEWLKERGFMWYRVELCILSVDYGHFEMLKWAFSNGCHCDYCVYEAAAAGGHLEILKWLMEKCGPLTIFGILSCLDAALMYPSTFEYLEGLLKQHENK